jgi:transposase
MKGAVMYNKVQALLSEGKSQRHISRELGINRRTVKKLSLIVFPEASEYFNRGVKRTSKFDIAHDFIESKLRNYNGIRASNLYHQVQEKYPEIGLSERAFRDYVRKLRSDISDVVKKQRYFEPVTDWLAGKHMQVDGGEKIVSLDNGGKMKVYFISFVLCYSRQMYVHYSSCPYHTELFIDAHISAFQSFMGIPAVGIYDQTKLVAIREEYREVLYNERFQRFFLGLGFQADVCEGYDPQSKGMVEKSIDYIKESFLHGREFSGTDDIQAQSDHWLSHVANVREHQTTLRKPMDLFMEEQHSLRPLDSTLFPSACRKVDKTGLITYQGCSYSVPFLYQGHEVRIRDFNKILSVYDSTSNALITEWNMEKHRERINKNENHYVDYKKSIAEELEKCKVMFAGLNIVSEDELFKRLTEDNRTHLRAQYRGLRKLLHKYEAKAWETAMNEIIALPIVSCLRIEKLLRIKQHEFDRSQRTVPNHSSEHITTNRFRDLDYYNRIACGGHHD